MSAPAIASSRGRTLRTVQVSFYRDALGRDAEALLEAWPTLPNVASAVARAGASVTVVQAAARRQTLERDGVSYRFVDDGRAMPARLLGTIPVVRRPARIIAEVAALAPDVVHVHGFAYPVAVAQLARALPGTPLLVQDHASHPPTGWRRVVWRASYRSLAAATFTVREQADGFIAARVFPAALPVHPVLEGSSTFTPGDRAHARARTGMTGDPCVLWAAHLNANKDPLTALQAFRLATAALPAARLWCCYGAAPMEAEVRQLIARSPELRDRVTLVGACPPSEMQERFRAADYLLQASRRESCGYSVLEALACGTMPVVTDIPSFRRIVGRHGSLTPVGDAAAMAEGLVRLARGDRAAQRRDARTWFEAALSFDRIGVELRDVYHAIAAPR